LLFFVMKQLQLVFFMYSYIFIQWDTIIFHVIPRIPKYTYENGVTWQNSEFLCYEVDLIKNWVWRKMIDI
jgi:hypothetical protein